MRDSIEISRKSFYWIVAFCAIIIMANSIEVLFKVKDNSLFELWFSNPSLNKEVAGKTIEEAYSIYFTACLSTFFIKIITPIALAINSYLALVKLRVNKLFVQMWIVLLIGLFAFTLIGESFYSIFFIITAICYVGLVVMIVYLWKEINRKENEQIIGKIEKV